MLLLSFFFFPFFFFNAPATTEIYTLSLHDALPILYAPRSQPGAEHGAVSQRRDEVGAPPVARAVSCRVGGVSPARAQRAAQIGAERGREIGRASCRERV